MASKGVKILRTNGNSKKVITFQILPNGTGTPTIAENNDGFVASVTRTGVGVYAIVLAEAYLALASISIQVQLATAANTFVQLTSQTVATTKIVTTTILTAGAAADIAANAGNILHFTLVMRDGGGQ